MKGKENRPVIIYQSTVGLRINNSLVYRLTKQFTGNNRPPTYEFSIYWTVYLYGLVFPTQTVLPEE